MQSYLLEQNTRKTYRTYSLFINIALNSVTAHQNDELFI